VRYTGIKSYFADGWVLEKKSNLAYSGNPFC